MKESELRDAVIISRKPVGKDSTMIIASIQFHAALSYSNAEAAREELFDIHMEHQVMDKLIRHIYDDRSHDIHAAFMDLLSCNPFEYAKIDEARGKLLYAATHQPPRPWTPCINGRKYHFWCSDVCLYCPMTKKEFKQEQKLRVAKYNQKHKRKH